nr:hypothetical protein GCM10020093_001010 [Planobispora longispora]
MLRERLAGRFRPVPSAAGLHLCARLAPDAGIDLGRALDRAREAGVGVESLARYCGEAPAQEGLVIGYGAIRTSLVDEGLRRLAACLGGDG